MKTGVPFNRKTINTVRKEHLTTHHPTGSQKPSSSAILQR